MNKRISITSGGNAMKTRMYPLLAILMLLCCFTAAYGQVFQTGTFNADRTIPNFSLDQGSGERTATIEVTFEKPFEAKPVVAVSVNTIDAAKESNTRYTVKAISISRDGFVVQIRTWADSKIFQIGGSWIAYASK